MIQSNPIVILVSSICLRRFNEREFLYLRRTKEDGLFCIILLLCFSYCACLLIFYSALYIVYYNIMQCQKTTTKSHYWLFAPIWGNLSRQSKISWCLADTEEWDMYLGLPLRENECFFSLDTLGILCQLIQQAWTQWRLTIIGYVQKMDEICSTELDSLGITCKDLSHYSVFLICASYIKTSSLSYRVYPWIQTIPYA